MSAPNRKYKDSVFVDLFSEDEKAKENFLSLYNALHDTDLDLSCPVENIRLDNVMYMNILNDVSCLVDDKIIILAEHQSTINENMPNAHTVQGCTVCAYEGLSKNFSFWTVSLDVDAMFKIKSLLYNDLILNSRGCRKSNQLLRHPHRYCVEKPPSIAVLK